MTSVASNATRIKLLNVRITFPKLFEAEKFKADDKDAYYSASFLLPKDHPQLSELARTTRKAAAIKWKDKAEEMLMIAKSKDKLPIHDGMMKALKSYGAEYAGNFYVSARNNARTGARPGVYDNVIDPATGKARIITSSSDPRAPYSGMYVNVHLDLFGYKQGGGEGIGASIAGVQYHRDGERLSGGSIAAAEDFEAIPLEIVAGDQTVAESGAATLF